LYGIQGSRILDYTGVWVNGEKICAIGIKTSRWITMHGFALNVTTDLDAFGRIIPCGIFERGVTSLAHVLGKPVPLEEVARSVAASFGTVFNREMRHLCPEESAQVFEVSNPSLL
jgi:lipoyl(octanoyl) transferase